ncbi:MAG: hypothetical protein QM644_18365 [Mobilitalea sp.]
MTGYIKLHRKILENPIVCKDAEYFAVWGYLLLYATHKEISAVFKGKRIVLHPGQLITGRISISERLKISESKVKRILIEFESNQQIDRVRTNRNSLITIRNWSLYQYSDQQVDQPMANIRPASDQPLTTNKNVRINDTNISICKNLNPFFLEKYKEREKRAKDFMDNQRIL